MVHGVAAAVPTRTGVMVAAPALDNRGGAGHAGVLIARLRGRTWSQSWIETPPLWPGYVTLTSVDDTVSLAFVGGILDSTSQSVNGVFVARSANGGESWTTPRMIRRLPDGVVGLFPVGVSAGGPPQFHLMWIERPTTVGADGALRATLHHVRSADGGRTWDALPELALERSTDMLDAAGLRTGEVVVVVRALGTGTVGIATWTPAGWSAVTTPFEEKALTVPVISKPSPDSLLLFWGTPRPSPSSGAVVPIPYLVRATRPTSCRK